MQVPYVQVPQKVCAWARSDIEDGRRIYNALTVSYLATAQYFSEDVSLFKVYFYDILKLLTQSHYKKKELDYGIQPKERHMLAPLLSWPYLGYSEIINGVNFSRKKYGKSIAIGQSLSARAGEAFVGMRDLLRRDSEKPTLLVTSPSIDQQCNLLLDAPNPVKLVKAPNHWFALPDLEQQMSLIIRAIYSVMDQCEHPLSPHLITELIARHIRANTRSGLSDIKLEGDVVVLSSGIELKNRMLGSVAKQRGLKVVNVMHGEAFGVYDEPHFSTLGEIAYSDIVLGYGNAVLESSVPYNWGLGNTVQYIGSNGTRVSRMHWSAYAGIAAGKNTIKYYYFPTTLAGSSHRYGPFRDIPDTIYIEWQSELSSLFGDSLIFKIHPKEKYGRGNVIKASQSASGVLENLIDDIDVFVFDYIGTAFNIACATEKPVVYFDLGIRSIHPEALEAIKRRVIYIDVQGGIPSKMEIDSQVRFGARPNTFTQRYSLGGDGKRSRSLITELAR